ncbi:MAG: hypothetical protein ACXWP5_16160, partial [Bdellovibrionota bacterium]
MLVKFALLGALAVSFNSAWAEPSASPSPAPSASPSPLPNPFANPSWKGEQIAHVDLDQGGD